MLVGAALGVLGHLGVTDVGYLLLECIARGITRVDGGHKHKDRAVVYRILESSLVVCHGISAVLKVSERRKAGEPLRLNKVKYLHYLGHILA